MEGSAYLYPRITFQAPSHNAQRKTPTTAAKRIATASTKAHTNHSARRNESTRFSSNDSRTGAPVNDNVTAEEKRDSMTCSPSAKGLHEEAVEATHSRKIATTCSNASAVVAIGISGYRTSRLPLTARKLLEGCLPARADIEQGGTPADASIGHGAGRNQGDAQGTHLSQNG